MKTALKHGLTPLVCIGNSHEEKSLGVSAETVIKQMKINLFEIDKQHPAQVVIAYGPIWAINKNGIAATPEEAQYIHHQLRSALVELYGQQIAYQMILLYGGSVNLENSTSLIAQPDIDGLFIGRSAWQATGFCNILSAINQQN
ncbi:triose-phosphate isomerase [Gilliamella sp. B14448G11]|nr:triose-phosphate isomerase [Gilliamella sp. B14448G7]MBI0035120.1 triose-phosphate isomerase [Gilliamella sp. B14448G11]MBI0042380.1 triose-phosphate isomerase [Gilliamella sp. B14448G12]